MTPDEAMRLAHDLRVSNRVDLAGEWEGWKLRGRDLVSPDRQRVTPERMAGLLWRDQMELRRAGYASRRQAEKERHHGQKVKVVIVELREFLHQKRGAA